MDLSLAAIASLEARGISREALYAQLDQFEQGTQYARIVAPAQIGDGIQKFSSSKAQRLVDLFESTGPGMAPEKFVPASGAATRMFQFMHRFVQDGTWTPEMEQLALRWRELPFSKEWAKGSPARQLQKQDWRSFALYLLEADGLNYGYLPKALIPFHGPNTRPRTPIMEQIAETGAYALDETNTGRLHFTISPEHLTAFQNHIQSMGQRPFHLNWSYSFQQASTDTVAVDTHNHVVIDSNGGLVFRPGGHGSLIHNLNQLKQPLIFIKNIDNVGPPSALPLIAYHKKVLAGYALELHEGITNCLRDAPWDNPQKLRDTSQWIHDHLGLKIPKSLEHDAERLERWLRRPLRVCGMVRNEGQPGGGPFWVQGDDGCESLQIVEMSQINLKDPEMAGIISQATHFNPVDIVCMTHGPDGQPYNLIDFTDPNAYFISEKSIQGKPIKALEWPGLWNGGMANWNTAFIEVPLDVFRPVKTILDLLHPNHLT
ncbi:MAG: DUF4301 family protein [Acidobacteria bacterium]|nr:DUF4301 family protein [Acidobacteriota bacterium]